MSDLLKKIENLPNRLTPVATKKDTSKHSDGLSQTHYQDVYSSEIEDLKKEIWHSAMPLSEKLQANELLANKMKL